MPVQSAAKGRGKSGRRNTARAAIRTGVRAMRGRIAARRSPYRDG